MRAARRALENAGMQAEELELIVVATLSGDRALPNTGCEVQRELNAVHATAFEINAACSGFLFALNTVQAYMAAGLYRKALVIGGEVLSKLVDWQDRNTCVLFGDLSLIHISCGLAARSNFSHFTMEQAIDLFRKAGKCSKGNPEQQQLLYHLFTVEVIKAVQRYEDTFSSVSMTNEIVESYRNSMRLAADALQEAVALGERLTQFSLDGESSVLSAKKLAVHCMVEL